MIQNPTIHIELLGPLPLYIGMGIQILTSLILGGLVGFDREKKMKAAGIKTNILICLGATLYTSVSVLNIIDGSQIADPNRTGAQIVSGIGFLGAGAIIQGRGGVKGLTTAASIWVVAAIGMTIGAGYPLVAALFTFTILFVLKVLDPVYSYLESEKDWRDYHVEVLSRGKVKGKVVQVMTSEDYDVDEVFEEILDREADSRILNLTVRLHPRRVNELRRDLKDLMRVEKVNFRMVEKPE